MGPSVVILIQYYYSDTTILSIITCFYTIFNNLSEWFKSIVVFNCIFFCIHFNINNNIDNNNINNISIIQVIAYQQIHQPVVFLCSPATVVVVVVVTRKDIHDSLSDEENEINEGDDTETIRNDIRSRGLRLTQSYIHYNDNHISMLNGSDANIPD